jgi:hypothetical protein
MSHNSLFGSTISTRSKKSVSCATKNSLPNDLSHDTNTLKVSEKDNPHDFYPKNFNNVFSPKPDFEGYKNNPQKEFEENQNYIGGGSHQICVGKRLGMMMKLRRVGLYRMPKILVWLIQFLKNL